MLESLQAASKYVLQGSVEAIARAYADRPAGTIIVSPDNVSRRAINEQVRQELQKRGALAKDETPLPTLIPRNEMTGADRAWASAYHVGDVLRYARGSRELASNAAATLP
jgi:hypothetical protein